MARLRGPILSGDEFLQACAEARARGDYIQRVDVVGKSSYRIRVLPAVRVTSRPKEWQKNAIQIELPMELPPTRSQKVRRQSAWWFTRMHEAAK